MLHSQQADDEFLHYYQAPTTGKKCHRLEGDDAYEFVAEMEKQEKASAEEKARVAKGASFIQSLLTFSF